MGLFKLFSRKHTEQQLTPQPPPTPPETLRQGFLQDITFPDQNLNPYTATAFQPRTDRDMELLLSKLEIIAARLENIGRRLEMIERFLQASNAPANQQQQQTYPRRW